MPPKIFRILRSHFLIILLCLLVLPPVAVVFFAVAGMVNQENAMEAAVSSYVQDLAESMAYHLSSDDDSWDLPLLGDVSKYPFFSWGPSIPGWVALIGRGGNVIIASPGAVNIANIWRDDLPVGEAIKIVGKDGKEYTLDVKIMNETKSGYEYELVI